MVITLRRRGGKDEEEKKRLEHAAQVRILVLKTLSRKGPGMCEIWREG